MITFKLLPPYGYQESVLPFKEYVCEEQKDIVKAYEEVQEYIANNLVGTLKNQFIRLSHAIKDGQTVIIGDIVTIGKKAYMNDGPFKGLIGEVHLDESNYQGYVMVYPGNIRKKFVSLDEVKFVKS